MKLESKTQDWGLPLLLLPQNCYDSNPKVWSLQETAVPQIEYQALLSCSFTAWWVPRLCWWLLLFLTLRPCQVIELTQIFLLTTSILFPDFSETKLLYGVVATSTAYTAANILTEVLIQSTINYYFVIYMYQTFFTLYCISSWHRWPWRHRQTVTMFLCTGYTST